jgi:hypothetical protein
MPLDKPAGKLAQMSRACFAEAARSGRSDAGCRRMAREASAKRRKTKRKISRKSGGR